MKIHSEALIEKACSKDAARTALALPYLDTSEAGKPVVVATNGRIMAIIPATAHAQETGRIGLAALKAARKAGLRNDPEIDIEFDEATRAHKLLNGAVIPREDAKDEVNYPQWRQVLPRGDRTILARFSINPKELLDLALALGAGEGITLEFEGEGKPVTVRPSFTGTMSRPVAPVIPEAYGVQMPIRQPEAAKENAA